ncbi:MAG: protein-L-isoaspartate O-methyltransferase [Adhaeribacter sp.]|nr:protein-L-isoaspartate O-methyltransferase [Adhaeribacter sp.]
MERYKRLRLFSIVFFVLLGCSPDKDNSVTPSGSALGLNLPANSITKLENEQDLDPLLKQIGNARYVLLGEASHGTAEFYTWRAAISRRLIQEKGFNLIAVEGDWPSAYKLNQYIRGTKNLGSPAAALQYFNRWPTWMWANQEIADLATWLRQYNQNIGASQQVGFYGLDLYSMWESVDAIANDFVEADEATRATARSARACLAGYADEQVYAQATLRGGGCRTELDNLLTAVQNRVKELPSGHEGAFNAEQNALVALNGENYYHNMVLSNVGSWNIRDRHMVETINRLMAHHGNRAKIIVWEHNTHVGDARFTDMAASGMVNVGQLVREQHPGEGIHLVGFGTYTGTVIASANWGGAITTMSVPKAPAGSWEAILHEVNPPNKIIDLQAWRQDPKLTQERGHRAIGVQYNSGNEQGNYVPTNLPQRYDSFIFIDQTKALHPLNVPATRQKAPNPNPEQLTSYNF